MVLQWERMHGRIGMSQLVWRAPIEGGWLVTTTTFILGTPRGITFVPDSEHRWVADETTNPRSASARPTAP